MKQLGLTDTRLVKRSKRTRKEQFLEEMNAIIPWQRLIATIKPHYPEAARGRRRVPLETMLRIHLCSTCSTTRIRRWKKRCMKYRSTVGLLGLIWRLTPSLTRPRSASSGICSSANSWRILSALVELVSTRTNSIPLLIARLRTRDSYFVCIMLCKMAVLCSA